MKVILAFVLTLALMWLAPNLRADAPVIADPGVTSGDLASTARHEAGHAAVAREFGWAIRYCHLNPDGSGYTAVWFWRMRDRHQRLAVLYAGEIASGVPGDSPHDREQIGRILSTLPPDEQVNADNAAYELAERIVSEREDEIRRDAATLLERGSL